MVVVSSEPARMRFALLRQYHDSALARAALDRLSADAFDMVNAGALSSTPISAWLDDSMCLFFVLLWLGRIAVLRVQCSYY